MQVQDEKAEQSTQKIITPTNTPTKDNPES